MEEITQELESRDVSLCFDCGAIYDDTYENNPDFCPTCNSNEFYFITAGNNWIQFKRQGVK